MELEQAVRNFLIGVGYDSWIEGIISINARYVSSKDEGACISNWALGIVPFMELKNALDKASQ